MQAVSQEVIPLSFPVGIPQRKRRTRRTAKPNANVFSEQRFFTHKVWGTGRVLLKPDFSHGGYPCAVLKFADIASTVRLDGPWWLEDEQIRLEFFEEHRPKSHEPIKVCNSIRGNREKRDKVSRNRELALLNRDRYMSFDGRYEGPFRKPITGKQARKRLRDAGVGGDCDLGLLSSVAPDLAPVITGNRIRSDEIRLDRISSSKSSHHISPEVLASYLFWKERHGEESPEIARKNIVDARRRENLDAWLAQASLHRREALTICSWYDGRATVYAPSFGGSSAAKKGSKVVTLWTGDKIILETARPRIPIDSWTPGRALSRALSQYSPISLSVPLNVPRDSWSGWKTDPNSDDDSHPACMEERQYLESATLVEPAEHLARDLKGVYINRKYRDALKIVKYLPPVCKLSGEPYDDAEIAVLTGVPQWRVRAQRYKIRALIAENHRRGGFEEQLPTAL
jgi:hypothetical protein